MRLRRIEMQNFRRHRHTVWEVPDGVTAVVGANGAGKSSIVEAIGFALYGPRATRTAKDLLRWDGAAPSDNVLVTLEAEVAGQAWTLTRELRGRGQEPRACLTIDGVVIVPPGAGSSEQATAKVEQALGLDRDGFFQTVVARQGELDRLGQMKAADRRTFILGMVGIGAVDGAILRAREERNATKARLEEASRGIPDPAALQARVDAAAAAQRAAEAALGAAAARRDMAIQAQADVQAALAQERQAAAAHQGAAAEMRVAQLRLEQAEATQRDAAARVANAQAAKARHAELLPRAQPLEALQQRHAAAVQYEHLQRSRADALRRVAALRAECEAAAARLAADVPGPEPPGLQASEEALQTSAERFAAAAAAAHQAAATLSAAEGKARRLVATAAPDEHGQCPTCAQPVTADHLARMHGDAMAEVTSARQVLAGAREAEAQAAAVRDAAARSVQQARAARAAWEAQARRRADAVAALEARRAAARDLEASVPPEPAAPGETPAAIAVQLREAQAARDEAIRLHAVAEQLPELQRRQAESALQAQGANDALRAARERLAAVPDNAPRLAALDAQARTVAESVRQAEAASLQATLAHRDAQRDAEQAGRELQHAQRARAHARELAERLGIWTALASQAGDGLLDRFKDHLIARTAPAIQAEASRLLSLFTQGKYTEMLLDEDYEVWIRDGADRYAIERFSGGEQDLAHLALRLAISRLLATRSSGAEVRLLVLDEVFGALDAQHRDLVVAALHQLGGIYSQVLAITHDEGLQDVLDQAVRVELVDGEARLAGSGESGEPAGSPSPSKPPRPASPLPGPQRVLLADA